MAMSTDFRNAARLADVIGLTPTLVLCGWYGKENIKCYVPTTANDSDHLLRKLVGDTAFDVMVRTWPGERLDIPSLDLSTLQRAGQIYRLAKRGLGASDIATAAGITRQHVHHVRNRLRLEGWFDLAEEVPDIGGEA